MEAEGYLEKLVFYCQITRRHISEYKNIINGSCENLNSHNVRLVIQMKFVEQIFCYQ